MRDKRWLKVLKFDGVLFPLFFVSFSSDSSSLLLLIKVWNPHVMDTDEWCDLEFSIWFLQTGHPVGWWLSTLSSCSQWRLHPIAPSTLGPSSCLSMWRVHGKAAERSWYPVAVPDLNSLRCQHVWTSSLPLPTSFSVTFCLLHFLVEQ